MPRLSDKPITTAALRPTPAIPLQNNGLEINLADCTFIHGQKLSHGTFRAKFTFQLQTYYYSGRDRAGREKKAKVPGDETPDRKKAKVPGDEPPNNHLCRDWLSGIPMAKAGGWKRLFRLLCRKNEECREKELDILFGTDSDGGESEKDRGGELKFHHALFYKNGDPAQTEKYLIAPRDPATGKVKDAIITYEVVPPESLCELVIDYLPRSYDPERAANVWNLLLHAAQGVGEEAIGGKSSIWGRLKLISTGSEPEFQAKIID